MPCWTISIASHFPEAEWEEVLQSELLALPGWAGLMRRLEEDPGPRAARDPALLADGFSGGAADDGPRGFARGRGRDSARRRARSRLRRDAV